MEGEINNIITKEEKEKEEEEGVIRVKGAGSNGRRLISGIVIEIAIVATEEETIDNRLIEAVVVTPKIDFKA